MNLGVAALASALCLTAIPAGAQDAVAAFYRGKQLRIVVGSAVGGGYDLFARIVARHIGAHIPGHPNVIVQNQPAAGGIVMANQLYSQGPKDGTVIAAPINGLPTAPLLNQGPSSIRPSSSGSAAPIAKPTSRSSGTRSRSRA